MAAIMNRQDMHSVHTLLHGDSLCQPLTFLRLHAVEATLVLLGPKDPVCTREEDEPDASKCDSIGLEELGG